MLTGKPYWRAAWSGDPTVTQLLREICIEPISPASARAAELGAAHLLPTGFDGWFAACVTRAPSERFPDAQRAWAAFAALHRAASSAALTGLATDPVRDSMAFGATMNASSPLLSYSGPRAGMTPSGVATGSPEEKSRGGWLGILAALAFVGLLLGGVAAFALIRRSASRVTMSTAVPTASVTVVDTASAEPMAMLSSLSAPPPPPVLPPPPVTPPPTAPKPTAAPSVKLTDPSGMGAIPPARGNDTPPVATATTTAPAVTQGPPPDRSAIAASLRSISSTIQSCARSGGPTGPGKVTVVYTTNGYASTTSVEAPYAGTAVGGCIVSKYHKSVIPSFGGAPVTVTSGFTIR
jgi:hypothetical protein